MVYIDKKIQTEFKVIAVFCGFTILIIFAKNDLFRQNMKPYQTLKVLYVYISNLAQELVDSLNKYWLDLNIFLE